MKNDAAFFDVVRSAFGRLRQPRVDGFIFLLQELEEDQAVLGIEYAAYMLATAWHETGRTMQPVEERGHGKGRPYGEPAGPFGHVYYGRGYPQLTWLHNYKKFEKALGVPLVRHPELAMERDIAYQIMSLGMTGGLFTGRGLSSYFGVGRENPIAARRTVNGLDCAEQIAGHYLVFKKALEAGGFRA